MGVPADQLAEIDEIVSTEILNNTEVVLNEEELEFWSIFSRIINRPLINIQIGKTYGDPHIQTFDGHKYSFQTVGEYTLCTNNKGNFNVQVRQEAFGASVSLNTAVAMNVNGDIVCVYAKNHPDVYINNPVRVNGDTVKLKNESFLLENGGIIKRNNKYITIYWPTGEQVLVKLAKDFINVVPKVYTSNSGEYSGLLGNANGDPQDDLMINGGNQFRAATSFYSLDDVLGGKKIKRKIKKAEKTYNKNLIIKFGDSWRINDRTTLFNYKPFESTATYTDFGFPRVLYALADMAREEVKNAKKVCEDAGVSGIEMVGCISDIITTQDPSFATETALLSNNEVLLERAFNSSNRMLVVPPLEEIRKRELDTKEIQRKELATKERKNKEDRITLGRVVNVLISDESSSNSRNTISEKPIEEINIQLPNIPSSSKPSSSTVHNAKPTVTKGKK